MTGTSVHTRLWRSKSSMSLLQLADECKLSPSPLLGISDLRENCCSAGSRLPFSPSSLLIYELYFPVYSVLQHLEVVVGEYESFLPGSALVYRSCCNPAPFCFQCKTSWTLRRLKKSTFFHIPPSGFPLLTCLQQQKILWGWGELWPALSERGTVLVWYRLKNKSAWSEMAKRAPDCCSMAQPNITNHRQISPCSLFSSLCGCLCPA